jgi:putative membrane protein insertion efficiency factor
MNSWGRENDSERARLSLPARLFIQLIKSYQLFVSPRSGPCCRYTPSCSQYAIDALRIHGAFKGLFLAVWRIMRCNPFSRGGYDPVPQEFRFGPRRHASGMDKDGADRIQSEEEKEEYKENE